jgi:hypothetical protein
MARLVFDCIGIISKNSAGELPFRCEIILKVRKYLQFNHHNIKGDPNNEPEQ